LCIPGEKVTILYKCIRVLSIDERDFYEWIPYFFGAAGFYWRVTFNWDGGHTGKSFLCRNLHGTNKEISHSTTMIALAPHSVQEIIPNFQVAPPKWDNEYYRGL
jgi:hypothetical protein